MICIAQEQRILKLGDLVVFDHSNESPPSLHTWNFSVTSDQSQLHQMMDLLPVCVEILSATGGIVLGLVNFHCNSSSLLMVVFNRL